MMRNKLRSNKQNEGSLCQIDDMYLHDPEQALEGEKMVCF